MSQEPLDEWIEEAVAWLAGLGGESTGLAQALRAGKWRGARHLAAFQTSAGFEALSLVTSDGHWYMEGTSETAVLHLFGFAGAVQGVQAAGFEASERVAAWVRPLLQRSGGELG